MSLALARGREEASDRPFFTLIDAEKETILQLYLQGDIWSGQERGKGGLWKKIQQVYEQWQAPGSPGLSAYSVEWSQPQKAFYLHLHNSRTDISFSLHI